MGKYIYFSCNKKLSKKKCETQNGQVMPYMKHIGNSEPSLQPENAFS